MTYPMWHTKNSQYNNACFCSGWVTNVMLLFPYLVRMHHIQLIYSPVALHFRTCTELQVQNPVVPTLHKKHRGTQFRNRQSNSSGTSTQGGIHSWTFVQWLHDWNVFGHLCDKFLRSKHETFTCNKTHVNSLRNFALSHVFSSSLAKLFCRPGKKLISLKTFPLCSHQVFLAHHKILSGQQFFLLGLFGLWFGSHVQSFVVWLSDIHFWPLFRDFAHK